MGVAGIAAGILVIVYGDLFSEKIEKNQLPMKSFRKILVAAVALAPSPLFACAACYGKSDSPLAQGMNWGIFTLLGVVVPVLGCISLFLHPHRFTRRKPLQKNNHHNAPDKYRRPMSSPNGWLTTSWACRKLASSTGGQGGCPDCLCPLADDRAVHRLDHLFPLRPLALSRQTQSQGRLRRRQKSCLQLHRTGRGRR